MSRFFPAIAAVLMIFCANQLHAAPIISSFDGVIGSFTISPNGGGTATLTFDSTIQTTRLNGAISGPYASSFSSFTINTTPIAGPAGFTTYAVSNGTFTFTDGGSANFNLTGLQLMVVSAFPSNAIITDQATLTSSTTTNEDFSLFAPGSSFIGNFGFTLNASPVTTDLNSGIQGSAGSSVGGSASFSGDVAPIPEPTSILVFGIAAVSGILVVSGRRKAASI